jgi:hypothetical protein
MTRSVAGGFLCFAGSICFMACGPPLEEESVGFVAEPMVMLTPPKHSSGEPEYPVEGAEPPWPDKTLRSPFPPNPPPCEPPPEEEPPYEPPPEMPVPRENSPREGYNPHHGSESEHSSIPHGGPNAGDGIGHHGHMETSRGSSSSGDKHVTRLSAKQWRDICNTACEVASVAGCVAVHGACAAGAVWSFGGVLVPCEWAVLAACGGAATLGGACKAKCDEP